MRIVIGRPILISLTLVCSLMILAAIACDSGDQQRIDDANAAARNEGTATGARTGKISTFDLRTGDCYNEPDLLAAEIDETVDLLNVDLVPCSGPHDFEVLKLVYVGGGNDAIYPGEDYFDSVFYDECPQESDFMLFPIPESWELGDRVVTCLGSTG